MNRIKITSIILCAVAFLIVTIASTGLTDNEAKASSANASFGFSGTVTNGHPDLSWNGVFGTDYYIVERIPVSSLGGASKHRKFTIENANSFIDEAVHGAVLGPGLDQVRYNIYAYDQWDNLLDSDGPVDYTADSID